MTQEIYSLRFFLLPPTEISTSDDQKRVSRQILNALSGLRVIQMIVPKDIDGRAWNCSLSSESGQF